MVGQTLNPYGSNSGGAVLFVLHKQEQTPLLHGGANTFGKHMATYSNNQRVTESLWLRLVPCWKESYFYLKSRPLFSRPVFFQRGYGVSNLVIP